jgi:hypothetical protein
MASSARGSAVVPVNAGRVASIATAAAPAPASNRIGGRSAQQCTTTGASIPEIRSRSRSWASGARTARTVP